VTPCASPPPRPSIFPIILFWVHHLANWVDRQLLAHAMASEHSVAWQCLSKRTIVFSLRFKLHALRTPRPEIEYYISCPHSTKIIKIVGPGNVP
jgi:hypothetical protein